ncbi:hypothetical protein evm_012768 [Chilo suppressalis]|nr:hypothetical protein evm_012768 [Chilo suppressalis]
MVKIVVIGAGINGLACAVKIQEHFKSSDVLLISREFSPNTTGDGSGALWYPYLCGATPQHLLNKWGSVTYRFLHELWLQGGLNICAIPIYCLYREGVDQPNPKWASNVFGYQTLKEQELKYYNQLHNNQYSAGTRFTTFVLHSTTFLKYLKERFERANGKLLVGHVTSLQDPLLIGYDVIVNCVGLGARDVVPDKAVFPIRGQVSRVIAPWINQVIINEASGNYVIPNAETCVLGGTHQENDFNTNVDEQDKKFITEGCQEMFPGLQHARTVKHWVGLRPGRHEIRLEAEEQRGKLIVHNYGHGSLFCLLLFWR